jgi:hypothetical protein
MFLARQLVCKGAPVAMNMHGKRFVGVFHAVCVVSNTQYVLKVGSYFMRERLVLYIVRNKLSLNNLYQN